jgi:hypothetical protein
VLPPSNLDFADVVLTGGTGRSGTTIVGKLLSRHREVKLARPTEIKFLTSGNGLLDLVHNPRFTRGGKLIWGRNANYRRFEGDVFNKWWNRNGKKGGQSGLHQGIDEVSLKELLSTLEIELKNNRSIASANFMRSFIDYQMQGVESRYWLDTTPPNLMRADEIARLMPGVRFIHMIRDGRDVSSSVVRELWGPNEHFAALKWWEKRMKTILQTTREVSDQVLHIWLEDLVLNDRQHQLDRILNFLELERNQKFVEYFENEVTPQASHAGRWRREVENADKFDSRYEKVLKSLLELGLPKPKKQISS